MSLLPDRTHADRRFGIVLIAIFALGILGGAVATLRNGGFVPHARTVVMHETKTTAPL